jgi:general secretion pathway protein I
VRRRRTTRVTEPAAPGGADAGFTLIEVLVAFVIVAIVLAVVLGIFSGGLNTSRRADQRALAALLASSVLAATGREQPLVDGYTEGVFENGYGWRRWIEPYTVEPLFPQDVGMTAYRVTVTVNWPGARPDDGVTVSTLRLAGGETAELPPQ